MYFQLIFPPPLENFLEKSLTTKLIETVAYSLSLSLSLSPSILLSLPPPPSSGGSGVAILSDYREQQPQSSSKRDDDAQQFYAGGSEHSGQMIEGPPRKKTNPQDIAKEVFEAAKWWVKIRKEGKKERMCTH